MNEVYLYGASGHGKVIAEILEQNGDNIQGIFDDDPAVTGLLDYPALGGFDGAKLSRNARVIVSIGNNHQRCKVVNQLNVPFATAVHPGASVSKKMYHWRRHGGNGRCKYQCGCKGGRTCDPQHQLLCRPRL